MESNERMLSQRTHMIPPDLEAVDEETPFNPYVKAFRDGGNMSRQLPECIYSCAILAWLVSPGGWNMVKMCMPSFWAVLVSYVLQFGFGFFLLSTVGSDPLTSTCDGTSSALQFLALFSLCSLVVKDLLETFDMHLWMTMFPVADKHERLMLRVYRDHWGNQHTRPDSGVTRRDRILFYAILIIPKIMLAVLVLMAGCGVIVRSATNFDIVLNALAAAFILDLDEAIFQLYIPRFVRNLFQALTPLSVSPLEQSERPRRFGWASRNHFYLVICPVLIVALVERLIWCS